MLNKKMKKVSIIGGGFSGLSAACYAAKQGHQVIIFEKNAEIGGRSRSFTENGFTFDMGPSWYWMPEVFDRFFADFGKKTSDFYSLNLLDPGFQIVYENNTLFQVSADLNKLYTAFEEIEKGAAKQLKIFLEEAEFKYRVGMQELIYKPGISWFEYATLDVLKGISQTHLFTSVKTYVHKHFKDKKLRAIMEFPVLFLGAMPNQIPALYTLMNYAALAGGTWYPEGGMIKIIEGLTALATSLGVKFETGTTVKKLNVTNAEVTSIHTDKGIFTTDQVIASADYAFVERELIEPKHRNYSEAYWESKIFAPSCLIFYLGVNKRIDKLIHHTLFFDTDFDKHSEEIYQNPQWPSNPLFYVCCPSKSDLTVAPAGMENLFVLIPIATGLEDTEQIRESYFEPIIKRMESFCGESILEHIIYKKSYSVQNFITDYNSYQGNAYGLANTLMQTAVLKPKMKNKKIKNLIYTGQLTVPGPGVPPSLISGKIAASLLKSSDV
jgi:phytoene desaturase